MGVGVAAPVSQVPLVVDLDGTLLRTDTLHESAIRLLRDHPLDLALIPLWLTSGKAYMKRRIAGRITLEPSGLPYRQDLLEWLRAERDAGRTLVLCTAADCSIATAVSEHLGIFDAVMSSDGTTNLDGPRKADSTMPAIQARTSRCGRARAARSSSMRRARWPGRRAAWPTSSASSPASRSARDSGGACSGSTSG
jgi:hypothetical protein